MVTSAYPYVKPVFRYSTPKTAIFGGVTFVSPFICRGAFFKTGCSADLAG